MVQSWKRRRPGVEPALASGAPLPPPLAAARFPSAAPLIGALAMDAVQAGATTDGGPVTVSPRPLSEGLPA